MRIAGRKLFDYSVVNRLRETTVMALAVVVAVALLEAGSLVVLGALLPHYDTISGSSAERQALVNEIAYDSTVAPNDRSAATRAVNERKQLKVLVQDFKDITHTEHGLYARFEAESEAVASGKPVAASQLPDDAVALSKVFSARTHLYIARGERLRTSLVIGIAAGSIVLLLAAIGLYFFVTVPTVVGVTSSLKNEALSRERLRIASSLAFARGDEVAAKIDETLAFAAQALGADAAFAGLLANGSVAIVHGTGKSYEEGETHALDDQIARRIYGSREVLAEDRYIATTLYIEDDPAGVVVFRSDEPRNSPLEAHDRDFVLVVAAFVGNAMERERRERELSEMAYRDPLTRLENRAFFTERLEEAIAQAHRHNDRICVHYIDLDGFKRINDELGHAAGDEVLRVISARMRAAVRGDDLLARVGGDEFLALQLAWHDDEGAMMLGRRLVDAASEPMVILGVTISLGASVGIARYPRDAKTAQELVARADQAMYYAKRNGKNNAVLFDPQLGPAA